MLTGKTAPRLLQDLLTYDPRREERAGRNLLTTAPPEHNSSRNGIPAVPRGNCRHALVRKAEQSLLPIAGGDDYLLYKSASYCSQCRWHIDVIVNFKDRGSLRQQCGRQNADYPLHHFVCDGADNEESNGIGSQRTPKSFNFRCTADPCSASVRIDLKPPHFTEHDEDLLMNKAKLRRRFELARSLIGERDGETMARSVDGPDFLDTFLRDSLNPAPGKTRVPLLNRKFAKTFWRDCDSILTKLGFGYTREKSEEEEVEYVEAWDLPKLDGQEDPLESSLRSTVQDARYELNSMILAVPENDRQGVRHQPLYPVPSQGDIERILACHDCKCISTSASMIPDEDADDKVSGRTRSTSTTEEDHPYVTFGLKFNKQCLTHRLDTLQVLVQSGILWIRSLALRTGGRARSTGLMHHTTWNASKRSPLDETATPCSTKLPCLRLKIHPADVI